MSHVMEYRDMQRWDRLGSDETPAADWAALGARILAATQQAVSLHHEEARGGSSSTGVPYLRLVRAEAWDGQTSEREAGSAA